MVLKKIPIAEILKPQGIKGELKIKADAAGAKILQNVGSAYLNEEKQPRAIKGIRFADKFAYIFLEGVITRNDAEAVRGGVLSVPKDSMMPLEGSDTYLIEDMLGCKVVNDTGETLGAVFEILQHGSADVICVRKDDGSTLMFPFLLRVVTDVSISKKLITVDSQNLLQVMVTEDR